MGTGGSYRPVASLYHFSFHLEFRLELNEERNQRRRYESGHGDRRSGFSSGRGRAEQGRFTRRADEGTLPKLLRPMLEKG